MLIYDHDFSAELNNLITVTAPLAPRGTAAYDEAASVNDDDSIYATTWVGRRFTPTAHTELSTREDFLRPPLAIPSPFLSPSVHSHPGRHRAAAADAAVDGCLHADCVDTPRTSITRHDTASDVQSSSWK